jgi:hypothetical protein
MPQLTHRMLEFSSHQQIIRSAGSHDKLPHVLGLNCIRYKDQPDFDYLAIWHSGKHLVLTPLAAMPFPLPHST